MKTSLKRLVHRYTPEHKSHVPGWGTKPSSKRARILASLTFRKPIYLEDGFLRSFGRDDKPVSLVADEKGIYYSAAKPSRLEDLIKAELGSEQVLRTRKLIDLWCQNKISKYNNAPDFDKFPNQKYVLIVDQVAGDNSLSGGLAKVSVFETMITDALRDHPDSLIFIKAHPDTEKERKTGHYTSHHQRLDDRVRLLTQKVHIADLIRNSDAVYTATSQTGFEALLHGVPVYTYGVPFYAGWGLTNDRSDKTNPLVQDALRRRTPVTLEQLVYASLITYPRYINPHSEEPATPEEAIISMGRQRRHMASLTGVIHAVGFSMWKRPIVADLLKPAEVRFHTNMKSVPDGSVVALWGAHGTQHLSSDCQIIRIEDGFIRSNGLGAELTSPSSLVLDRSGIYFDSTKPSDIETILQNYNFPDEVIMEGKRLKAQILEGGFTKYNIRGHKWHRPKGESRVILVPGQVESDASIKFGSPVCKTNLDLIKSVRIANPDAYVVYKPHPDVEGGFRATGEHEGKIPQYCDEVMRGGDILYMLDQVDEVHTITSLTGFEALMRGVPVTCYGQPFYSGWGITNDLHPCKRRTRKRTLDEVIAATLIEYPRYMSKRSRAYIDAASALNEIANEKTTVLRHMPFRRALVKQIARKAEKKREANT